MKSGALLLLFGFCAIVAADTGTAADGLLREWQATAPRQFSTEAGAILWTRKVDGRSCVDCHTESALAQGRHVRTGKLIGPLAPSANPNRLTKRSKIRKWLFRNCKWTFGRVCTAQEKGDLLLWLQQQ